MLQRLFGCILVVLLGLFFVSTTFSQDVKKEVKKETKPAVVNEVKKDVKKETKPAVAGDPKKDVKKSTKPPTMKFVSCNQTGCGFWAKSHSAKELRYIMKRHAKKYHKTELADKQLKEMVKKEGAK
jgi:predicted small metal-binding protein